MGWVRVHNKFDTPSRVCTADHGQVLAESVCELLRVLYSWPAAVHADTVRWVPADPD